MAHGAALRRETQAQDGAIIETIQDWHKAPGLDRQDVAMLDFVERVTVDASSCTRDDIERLKALGFSDQEILEMVLVCCWYNVQTRLADALGVELDEGIRANTALLDAFAFGKRL